MIIDDQHVSEPGLKAESPERRPFPLAALALVATNHRKPIIVKTEP